MSAQKIIQKIVITGVILLLVITANYSATRKKYAVFSKQCVGCMDCTKLCPKKAIEYVRGKAVIDTEKCIGCKKCYYICSYGAIK